MAQSRKKLQERLKRNPADSGLRLKLLELLLRTGHEDEVFEQFRLIVAHQPSVPVLLAAHIGLAESHVLAGRYRRAINILEQAAPDSRDLRAVGAKIVGRFYNVRGLAAYYLEQYSAAKDYYRQSLRITKAAKHPAIRIRALYLFGITLIGEQNYDDALIYLDESSQLAQSSNSTADLGSIHLNLGTLYERQLKILAAIEAYKQAIEIASNANDHITGAIAHFNLANLYDFLGSDATAEQHLSSAERMSRRYNLQHTLAYYQLLQASRLRIQEDFKGARSVILESCRSLNQLGRMQDALLAKIELARIHSGCGQSKRASHYARQVLRFSNSPIAQAKAKWIIAGAIATPTSQSIAMLEEAIDFLEVEPHPTALGLQCQVLQTLAEHHRNLDDAAAAQITMARAKSVFEQLNKLIPASYREEFRGHRSHRNLKALVEDQNVPLQATKTIQDYRNTVQPLLELSRQIHSFVDIDMLLEFSLATICQMVQAQRGYITTKHRKDLTTTTYHNATEIEMQASAAVVETVLSTGKPINNATETSEGVRHLGNICLPLVFSDETIGVIYLEAMMSNSVVVPETIEILSAICDQVAVALNSTKLIRKLVRKQKTIRKLSRELAVTVDDQKKQIIFKDDLLATNQDVLVEKYRLHNIVTCDQSMIAILEMIERLSSLSTAVLVQGETGTGKELVAKALHFNGNRKDRPFVSINVAAMPINLVESEFFGHERGEFTGAVSVKQGLFELADGGTLFLDEIGDMPLSTQVKLLRVLEEGEVRRIGGKTNISFDVRLVTATNIDLLEKVRAGKFREDLFFRINTVPLMLPPLRQRQGDIPLLTRHFLKISETPNLTIGVEAMQRLCEYQWPGNIRQLRNEISRLAVLVDHAITIDHLSADIVSKPTTGELLSKRQLRRLLAAEGLETIVQKLELEVVREAVDLYQGHKSLAAKKLGISRVTLYRHLNQKSRKQAKKKRN